MRGRGKERKGGIEGGGGEIGKSKDLAEEKFGNQCFTIGSGANSHRYQSPDRNIAGIDSCLLVDNEMR